jgi:hypothetical protein
VLCSTMATRIKHFLTFLHLLLLVWDPHPPSSNRHGQATRTFVCKCYSHNLLLNALDECPASILSSSITEVYVSSYQKLIIYEGLHAPIVVEG